MDPRLDPVYKTLRLAYGLVPIVAGLDKFTNLLTDWAKYLSEPFAALLPFAPETFMLIVGVIEIAAGILVLVRPRLGGWVVAAWLVAIALNLIVGGWFDIAVRDLVMALGAWTLVRLAVVHGEAVPHTVPAGAARTA
ncbi:MAG TPA: DoxX family membrane protein [Thermoanaerobaculia bacterium]|nr:DoxX family membrane protein [Thermoanaerobaculia bacterium]